VAVPVFEKEVVVDADGELEVPTEQEGVVVALSEIVPDEEKDVVGDQLVLGETVVVGVEEGPHSPTEPPQVTFDPQAQEFSPFVQHLSVKLL